MRGKEKVDRSGYLFSNRDLTALLIPLVIEQLLSVLVGMADSIMVASVGEAAVSGVSLVDAKLVMLLLIKECLQPRFHILTVLWAAVHPNRTDAFP